MKCVTDKKGYITLEAALVLPVMIIAVLSLGYYIKVFFVMENAAYGAIEEMALLSSKAYIAESAPFFINTVEERIEAENPEAENVNVTGFRYLYRDGDLDQLIYLKVDYSVTSYLPMSFGHRTEITTKVKSRGFKGVKVYGNTMTFEEMEGEGTWDPVWIFPSEGEKYHYAGCEFLSAAAEEMTLTWTLKEKYRPCSLCDAEEIPVGSIVYCFTTDGEVYHKGDCPQVKKYIVEINKEDAIEKGYRPCKICAGG